MFMRLLLISNSSLAGQAYLEYPKYQIQQFLGNKPVKALFIPYAAVTFSYAEYERKVNERFSEIGHNVVSIHRFDNALDAINNAEAIVIGGGNTWQLVRSMRQHKIIGAIQKRVMQGIPYIGWSAGANVACPSLQTTNDMPIADPLGFDTLNLVPFQINPHYLDANPAGHAGETRQQRIEEFLEINQNKTVVGLREGTMLKIEDKTCELIGELSARIFFYNKKPAELTHTDNFSFLLNQ